MLKPLATYILGDIFLLKGVYFEKKCFQRAVKFIFSHYFDFHFDKQNHTKHLPNWFDLIYGILNLQL